MDGDVPLYSIADSNLDLEFMMDSEINRILVAPRRVGGGALNPHKPAFVTLNVPQCSSHLKQFSLLDH